MKVKHEKKQKLKWLGNLDVFYDNQHHNSKVGLSKHQLSYNLHLQFPEMAFNKKQLSPKDFNRLFLFNAAFNEVFFGQTLLGTL